MKTFWNMNAPYFSDFAEKWVGIHILPLGFLVVFGLYCMQTWDCICTAYCFFQQQTVDVQVFSTYLEHKLKGVRMGCDILHKGSTL